MSEHLERVRRICVAFPATEERLSHGEPTWFVRKKVFAMFANSHHAPVKYFKPPYVGVCGWIAVELSHVADDDLEYHVLEAWRMVAPKRLQGVHEVPVGKHS